MLRSLHRVLFRRRHTCPWWFGYTFDNPLRRLVHDPTTIFAGLVEEGDTVVDVGCGLGYFTLGLARLVGPDGRVIAVDIQEEMVRRARRRAERHRLADRIEFRTSSADALGVTGEADLVLAFWMFHEVSEPDAFLAEIRAALAPSGRLLIAEPKGHVSERFFDRIVQQVRDVGFEVREGPRVRLSRSIVARPRQ